MKTEMKSKKTLKALAALADLQELREAQFGEQTYHGVHSETLKVLFGRTYLNEIEPFVQYRGDTYLEGSRSKELILDAQFVRQTVREHLGSSRGLERDIALIERKILETNRSVAEDAQNLKVVADAISHEWVSQQKTFAQKHGLTFRAKRVGNRIYNSLCSLKKIEKSLMFSKALENDLSASFWQGTIALAFDWNIIGPSEAKASLKSINKFRMALGGKLDANSMLGKCGAYQISQKTVDQIERAVCIVQDWIWIVDFLMELEKRSERVGFKKKGHKLFEQYESDIMWEIASNYKNDHILQHDGIVFSGTVSNKKTMDDLFHSTIKNFWSMRGVYLNDEEVQNLYSTKELYSDRDRNVGNEENNNSDMHNVVQSFLNNTNTNNFLVAILNDRVYQRQKVIEQLEEVENGQKNNRTV